MRLLNALLPLLVAGGLVGCSSVVVVPSTPAPGSPDPVPSPSPEAPPAQPKNVAPSPPQTLGPAWGGSSDYKFGRLPGGDYPNSCAFSRTDGDGRITTDKSQVEYWACRDVGGDSESGYSVAWADGKQTTYTFSNDGSGAVVGTNGSTFPMNWRNDSHQGSQIIVINHQDGATTWIPGHVN